MKLHNNKEEFRAAIQGASKEFKIAEHIIEKDYWVTKLLKNVSEYKFSDHIVFKGGTSLSKGHRLIKRFSEDVDLALHPAGVSRKAIHHKTGEALHRVSKAIRDKSFVDEIEGKESEGLRYKRVYSFPQTFNYPKSSPIHGKIVLEVSAFTTPSPFVSLEIRALLSDFLENHFGTSVIEELGLKSFSINTLSIERTFCEKLLALRRANFRGGEFFGNRIRHVYDIYYLFHSQKIQNWLRNDVNLKDMLRLCHKDDELNQKISEEFSSEFCTFNIFSSPREELKKYRVLYENLKQITFDGSLPEISEAAKTLKMIAKRLQGFNFYE